MTRRQAARACHQAKRLKRGLHDTSRKIWGVTSRAVRHPIDGIFPPIGLLAIVFLIVGTVGIPEAGSVKKLWPIYAFALVGVIVGFLLWVIPRNRYGIIFASTFGWLPVFLGGLSYGFWYWYASQLGGEPGSDFFHAAADVLPVLLLAAVVDVRRAKELQSKQLVLPIIAVFLGEISALNALAFGFAGPGDFAAVASSLVSTTVALVLAVMADLLPSVDGSRKTGQDSVQVVPPAAALIEPQEAQTAQVSPDSSIPERAVTNSPTGVRTDEDQDEDGREPPTRRRDDPPASDRDPCRTPHL